MEPSLATSCGPQTRTRRLTSPNRATRHPAPGARPSSWPAAPTKSQGLVKEARRDYRDPGHIAYGAGVLSRRELVRNAALAAAASLVGGCERAPASPHGQLRIATGGPGGVYYVYGQGLAEAVRQDLPGLTATVMTTGASVDNLRMLAAGTAEVAFALADSAAAAMRGEPPFDSALSIAALARLYENCLHVVVLANGPIPHLDRSEEHTSELQSHHDLVCRLLLEK